jgi:hypothetical protein
MRERDPYFAVLLLLVPLVAVLIGVAGPLFTDAQANGFIATLKGWQTLVAAHSSPLLPPGLRAGHH